MCEIDTSVPVGGITLDTANPAPASAVSHSAFKAEHIAYLAFDRKHLPFLLENF